MFPSRTLAATLAQAAWRGWRAKPFLTALNVLGLAIGIAVYLAIQIVNHSATRSFQAGIDLVAGRSHLEITGPDGLPDSLWPTLEHFPGIQAATPILEAYATLPDFPGEYLRLIGTDPFTATPFFAAAQADAASAWTSRTEDWLARPSAAAVNETWAQHLHLAPGASLVLSLNGRSLPLQIAATFPSPPGRGESLRTAFLDIGWAQELLGKPGSLSSIQLILDDPAQLPAVAAALQKVLPSSLQVQAPAQRNRQVGLMLQGFQLNLTALSLVSLLVGVFLISNTIAASVVRQRREIGVLRAIGASRTQVRVLFLAEAAFSALLGGLLGVPLARLIASSLLHGVSQTISAHYVLLSIDQTWVSPLHVAQALICGLLAALLGAWAPAREASALNPIALLRPGRNLDTTPKPWWKPLPLAGTLLALAAVLSFQALHSGPPWLSFAACLALVLGFVLLARPTAQAAAALAQRAAGPFPHLLLFRMGAAHLAKALHRAAPVIAALLTSVAMVLGVSIMIHSFRGTLALWVDSSLRADLYIAPAANEILKRSATLPTSLTQRLQNHPALRHTETLREERVTLADDPTPYTLRAVHRLPNTPLPFLSGDPNAQDASWHLPDHLAASEILASRHHWQPGQTVVLHTPAGPHPFTLAGIFYDYSDDQGCFIITAENHARHWPQTTSHAVAAFLRDPSQAQALEDEIRRDFSPTGALSIYQNQALRARVFDIFDQTFAVTELLRVIAIAVALLGITLALSTLVAERSYDIAALRAIGASRSQIAAIHLSEAGLIGLVSACLGMACGLLLSMILTWVVNKAFFGWTVRFAVPWADWASTPLWVTAVALLAGLLPAWKAASTNLAAALRSE